MRLLRPAAGLALLALLAFAAAGACGRLPEVEIPTELVNPPAPSIPPPPSPGESPSPRPSPSPGASPTPAPSPSSSPPAGSCSLPAQPDGSPCRAETPSFQSQVEEAQARVRRDRPDLFDGSRIRNEDAYVQEVARVLRTMGLCAAQGGPRDEVAVKNTNTFNDQYDIVLSTLETWTSYQVTCRPARF